MIVYLCELAYVKDWGILLLIFFILCYILVFKRSVNNKSNIKIFVILIKFNIF